MSLMMSQQLHCASTPITDTDIKRQLPPKAILAAIMVSQQLHSACAATCDVQTMLRDLDMVRQHAASLGIGMLHSVTSPLLRPCKSHFRRYGALGEVEEALKRKLQEQPKDMMLREEVSLGFPR